MRKKSLFSPQKSTKRFRAVLFFIAAIVFTVNVINVFLSAAVKDIARAEAINAASALINDAVNELVTRDDLSFSRIVTLHCNDAGEIVSADTDTVALNRFRAELGSAILSKFNSRNRVNVSIPAGSLFGGEVFSGRGPAVNVKIRNAGELLIDTSSVFYSAGINQTHYRLSVNMSISFTLILPRGTEKVTITSTIPVAERIVVGKVPAAYISSGE